MSTRQPYLMHLTLMSGHSHTSARGDLDAGEIALARSMIDAGLGGMVQRLPADLGDYTLAVERSRRGLLATVTYQPPLEPPTPIVMFGIATRPRDGFKLWPRLVAADVAGGGASSAQPPTPWCVVAMLPGVLRRPDAMTWLGGFEQAVAWAWLDRGDE